MVEVSDSEDPFIFDEEEESVEEEEEEEDQTEKRKRRAPQKRNRVPWTKKECIELEQFFGKFLAAKTVPGRKDVQRVMKEMKAAKCECVRREPHLIIKKISAINHKK